MKPLLPTNRAILLAFGGMTLAGAFLGCGADKEPTEEAKKAPVKAEPATEMNLAERTDFIGVTQPLPNRVARITARVEGSVKYVLSGANGKPDGNAQPGVVEGQDVDAGQIVVQLDDQIARENRNKAFAQLDDLKEQSRQAELAVSLARLNLNALEKLRPSSRLDPILPALAFTSQAWLLVPISQGMDADTRQPLVARIDLDKARLALDTALSQYQSSLAKQAAGAAEAAGLDAQLKLFALRAPIAGRLGLVQVTPGQTVTVGTPIADIVWFDELDVLCYVSPHAVRSLEVGQAARMEMPGDPEDDVDGVVEYVSLTAQPDTGNFAVKILFRNKDLKFRANSVVRVEVEVQDAKNRQTIPDAALIEDQQPPTVVVVEEVEAKNADGSVQMNEDGTPEKVWKARKLKAEVGVRDREKHVVELKGLTDDKDKKVEIKESMLFVTEGGHGLEDGDEVTVEKEESKKDEK
jgi:multidrug efflux pump subunit AcrA (membrane-fusion protein)